MKRGGVPPPEGVRTSVLRGTSLACPHIIHNITLSLCQLVSLFLVLALVVINTLNVRLRLGKDKVLNSLDR